ncbi:MAG: MarP family serine protease [Leifsonia sp.]
MPASLVLDLLVLLVLVGAAITGWRSGLLRSAFAAAGLVLGGVAAYLLLPVLSRLAPGPEWRLLIVIGGGLALLVIGEVLGSIVGRLASRGAKAIRLTVVDRVAGLVTSIVVMALVLATVAGGLGSLGVPAITQAIAGSATLGTIDRLTPAPAKAFLAGVRGSTVDSALPWVLDTIAPPTDVPPAADVDAGSPALTAAAASVVRVSGNAYECGVTLTGSGFVVSDDRVVTNAHVVAGVEEAMIEAPGEQPRAARVVYYDAATDLAVLDVPGLDAAPLPLGNQLSRGDGAAVQGYPFGGPFVSLPATVAEVSTIPRADGSIGREVYAIAADVNQGNSGGPLLAPDGSVVGVVFAKSSIAEDVGYALTLTELTPVAAQAGALDTPVWAGDCAA